MSSLEAKSRGESAEHRALKALAMAWACERGFTMVGTEVRLPKSSYRADVAAASPGQLRPEAVTAVFECKAVRQDFLRDAADERETTMVVATLAERLRVLTELIGLHRPDLRRGETLFPEYDSIDLRGSRHDTFRTVARTLRAAQVALYEGTKFAKLARWRAANFLYLVVEAAELVRRHEVPAGWGLLVREGSGLRCAQPPVRNEIALEDRIALLERIAARAK